MANASTNIQIAIRHAIEKKDTNPYYKHNPTMFMELVDILSICKTGYARSLSTTNHHVMKWINASVPLLNSNEYTISTKCYWILNGLTSFPKCKNPNCKHTYEHKNVKISKGYQKYCCVRCEVNTNGVLKQGIRKRWDEFHKIVPFYVKSQCKRNAYNKLVYSIVKQMPSYVDQIRWLVENRTDNFATILKTPQFKHLVDFINAQTPLLSDPFYSLVTKVYWVLNSITSWNDTRVKCKTCGKPFFEKNCASSLFGYYEHCNAKCQSNDIDIICQQVKTFKKNSALHQYAKDQTNLEKFGTLNWNSRLDVGQALTPEQMKNRQIAYDKFAKTMFDNHGIVCNFNGIKYKEIDDTVFMFTSYDSNDNKNKQVISSKQENACYYMLRFVFPRLLRQYKSQSYPFACDFYDPDLGIFFEFNGMWTHGGHWFNENDPQDIYMLQKMREKHTGFYESAIKTWTISDVNKRKTAIENNLNYVVFWNLDEVREYVLKRASSFGLQHFEVNKISCN